MATKHLTYVELAEIWGVSRDAARKKVEGLRLLRKPGNDGRTRVAIDLDEVTHTPKTSRAETGRRPDGDRPETTPGDREETGRSPVAEMVAVLQARITSLEARGEELQSDLERERGETARERSERLQERDRADRLTDEVAQLARQMATIVQEGGARENDLRDQLTKANEASTTDRVRADAAVTELSAWRGRPWWRRLRAS